MNSIFNNLDKPENKKVIEDIARRINDLYYLIKNLIQKQEEKGSPFTKEEVLLKCIEIYDQQKFHLKEGERDMFAENELSNLFLKEHKFSEFKKPKDVNFVFCCFAYQYDFEDGKYKTISPKFFKSVISETLHSLNGPERERIKAEKMVKDFVYKERSMPNVYFQKFKNSGNTTIEEAKMFIDAFKHEIDMYPVIPDEDLQKRDIGGFYSRGVEN